eukprot:Gregarina_sp_Poly_1__8824@NODE_52_length_17545_cov_128_515219_g44_i0_p4_GENE_NODE_52_length_17545_cov_128_515219_g44_i0NODE_52_length_17545_cov_128_515219_g44_i0_p4_ORF_typecomplete_len564_score56_10TPT/PF03151_16/3_6e14SLC35F/PF06027_12/3_5e14UAA/PF08449_11/2_9e13CRTlike/PF08627_10/6_8e03CRTlike/PF08627_10/2_3e09CRTlike/PF08627_10/85Nuc_sug_transp/PF04142_15/2e03Nuc_sug_transp/PF04142_15/3_4e09PUNUT/PF16913_5/0_0012Neurensin/PF14927_6/0_92Neurensin/PF14927_6/4_5e02Neurensin/PF14927_6/1_3e04_NOD
MDPILPETDAGDDRSSSSASSVSSSHRDESTTPRRRTRRFRRAVGTNWTSGTIAAVILLAFGTVSVLVVNFMSEIRSPLCGDESDERCESRHFEGAMLQQLGVSVGQVGALFIFLCDKFILRRGNAEQTCLYKLTNGTQINTSTSGTTDVSMTPRAFNKGPSAIVLPLRRAPILVWALPAVFDYGEVVLTLNALGPLNSEARQLIRNLQSLCSASIGALYLGQSYKVCVWVAIFTIVTGLTLTGGTTNLLDPDSHDDPQIMIPVAMFLTLLGTASAAFRWIIQERLAKVYHYNVFESIGWCGVFECALTVIGILIAQWADIEDVLASVYQVTHSIGLGLWFIVFIVVILGMNIAAALTSQLASALITSTLLSVRQCPLWLILVIAGRRPPIWYHLAGLVIVFLGFLIWNNFWIQVPPKGSSESVCWYVRLMERRWLCSCSCYCDLTQRDHPATDDSTFFEDEASTVQGSPRSFDLLPVAGGIPLMAAQDLLSPHSRSTRTRIFPVLDLDSSLSAETAASPIAADECWIYVTKEAEWVDDQSPPENVKHGGKRVLIVSPSSLVQ